MLHLDEIIKPWKSTPKLQMVLSEFGGEYKKAKRTQQDGRGQQPMEEKKGKVETDKMLMMLCSKLGISTEMKFLESSPGAAVVSHCWVFGYMPEWDGASLASQGLPWLKVFVYGEVSMYACSLGALIDAWPASKEQLTLKNLEQSVLALSAKLHLRGRFDEGGARQL